MNTKAIILRTASWGDHDLVVTALTSTGHKWVFLARAAKKSKKRFGGGLLEPTHYLKVSYKPSKDEEGLHTLMEASMIDDFQGVRKDWERLQTALHFVKLVDRFTHEGAPDLEPLFNLLGNALKKLETTDQPDLLRLHFEVKLLGFHGTLPELPGAERLMSIPIGQYSEIALDAQEKNALSGIHNFLHPY